MPEPETKMADTFYAGEYIFETGSPRWRINIRYSMGEWTHRIFKTGSSKYGGTKMATPIDVKYSLQYLWYFISHISVVFYKSYIYAIKPYIKPYTGSSCHLDVNNSHGEVLLHNGDGSRIR